jgi:hypothetical protein
MRTIRPVRRMSCTHSSRRTASGSTRVARSAGTKLAVNETRMSRIVTARNVTTSASGSSRPLPSVVSLPAVADAVHQVNKDVPVNNVMTSAGQSPSCRLTRQFRVAGPSGGRPVWSTQRWLWGVIVQGRCRVSTCSFRFGPPLR